MKRSGQALITLIFYVLIVLTVTIAAVILVNIYAISASKLQDGTIAYYIAESGAENAILRIIRNPGYTGEANLAIGDGFATIVITPGNPVIIVSTGTMGKYIRKIRVTAVLVNGIYTIQSWREIP
jgi:hypothetical protein